MLMFDNSTSSSPTGKVDALKSSFKRLISLYIENAKLTAAEKLTLLFSGAVVFVIGFILIMFSLAFLAVALLELLQLAMSPIASSAIIGGIFLVLAVLLIALRKALVINPMARFLSKLIMDIGKNRIND